jgi:anti-sigma regulatory factor (Ser/Thr protein kinase)
MRAGYFHDSAFYSSDDELLDLVMPFLTDGVKAGEPTLVAFGETNERLVRSELDDTTGITFLPGAGQYANPARTIKSYREMLAQHVAEGAEQIRIVGDVPHPGVGVPWDWWCRYETAVNEAYQEFPVWGLCPYDTRITPPDVLDDVVRTHPFIDQTPNPGYGKGTRETTRPAFGPPDYELIDPTPSDARIVTLEAAGAVAPDRVDDLVFAASEAVTNAICHGLPPTRLRLWVNGPQVVVAVTDQGEGPRTALAGLMPMVDTKSAGLGLYITHLTCDYVSLTRDAEGFTVTIVVG